MPEQALGLMVSPRLHVGLLFELQWISLLCMPGRSNSTLSLKAQFLLVQMDIRYKFIQL